MKKLFVLLMTGLLVSACTWIKLTDEGKGIRVVTMDDIVACKKVGNVMVKLKDTIAGFDRNEEKVRRELETLARNTVVELNMEGDSIVPISEIEAGKQTFAVYQCLNR